MSACKPVRPFRHINCSSPGYQGEFLENRGVPFEIACIGAQMIARARGANVSSGYRLEVGWQWAGTALNRNLICTLWREWFRLTQN